MVKAKLDDVRRFQWNIVNLLIVKEIIYNFCVHNATIVLWGKHICLDSHTIS